MLKLVGIRRRTSNFLSERDAIAGKSIGPIAVRLNVNAFDGCCMILAAGPGIEENTRSRHRLKGPVGVGRRIDRPFLNNVADQSITVRIGGNQNHNALVDPWEIAPAFLAHLLQEVADRTRKTVGNLTELIG
jgi:hypothetical protein